MTTSAGEQYGYAPDNKRVWKSAGGSEMVYFLAGGPDADAVSVAAGTYALTAERGGEVLRRAGCCRWSRTGWGRTWRAGSGTTRTGRRWRRRGMRLASSGLTGGRGMGSIMRTSGGMRAALGGS